MFVIRERLYAHPVILSATPPHTVSIKLPDITNVLVFPLSNIVRHVTCAILNLQKSLLTAVHIPKEVSILKKYKLS